MRQSARSARHAGIRPGGSAPTRAGTDREIRSLPPREVRSTDVRSVVIASDISRLVRRTIPAYDDEQPVLIRRVFYPVPA